MMVEKTEVMQIKKRGFTKTVYLCNKKGDLNGFQANFEAYLFLSICHNLTPVN